MRSIIFPALVALDSILLSSHAAAAVVAVAAGVGIITEKPHKGPDAPLDIELVYYPRGNTQCGGTLYQFHTFQYADACFTLNNPSRAFQIGLQRNSSQIGLVDGIGCTINLYTNANCSFGTPNAAGGSDQIIGTLPQKDNCTTYGTCYSSSNRALSANIGCGP